MPSLMSYGSAGLSINDHWPPWKSDEPYRHRSLFGFGLMVGSAITFIAAIVIGVMIAAHTGAAGGCGGG
jgi:hypothetical protein